MLCIQKEFVKTDAEGVKWWKCILTSDTEPVSLDISGADVDDLADTIGIAAGSILLTPDSNYIAFEDGVFTLKSSSGGGGGGGEGLLSIELSDRFGDYSPDSTDPELPLVLEGIPFDSAAPIELDARFTKGDVSDGDYILRITPTSNWFAIYVGGSEEIVGAKGEPIDIDITIESNNFITSDIAVANDAISPTEGTFIDLAIIAGTPQ